MAKLTTYEYKFTYPDGTVFEHKVEIDYDKKRVVNNPSIPAEFEEITALDYSKCSNCPLNSTESPKCPVAVQMIALVEGFRDHVSHEEVTVEVKGDNRTVIKTAPVQYGFQSVMGVVMATSGCPHLEFLAPMALHHLPFSNDEETMTRVLGFYFVEQFLKDPNGMLEVDTLKKKYQEVETVNMHFIKRIKELEQKDAGRNAIVILDTFIKMFSMEFSMNMMTLKTLFFKESE